MTSVNVQLLSDAATEVRRTPPAHAVTGAEAVARLVRPKSVAIIGASAKPESIAQNVMLGLKNNHFPGPIYLVGRSKTPINGMPVLASADLLPEGVDLAVLTLPAAGVRDAIAACARRKVGAAMVFAAGFAESGLEDIQGELARIALDGGVAICGPNCIGYTNNVEGLTVHMRLAKQARRLSSGSPPGIAFVGQSGGIIGHMQRAAEARDLPVSYVISTGNEAGLDLADYLEFLVEDPMTRVIVLYAEQIRRPAQFLAACRSARAAGKPVMLLHPGRSAKAQIAAQSHTGAMVGNHGVMLTFMTDAGVLVVETMDEMMDVSELLSRYPEPSGKGPAVITASGAFIALINDFAESLGLEFPILTQETLDEIQKNLPAFGVAANPLDTTAGLAPGSIPKLVRALLADPNVGSLFVSYSIYTAARMEEFAEGMSGSSKAAFVVTLGDTAEPAKDMMEVVKQGPFMFGRSSDRALRAIARYTAYGKLLAQPQASAPPRPFTGLPTLGQGIQPEWVGKELIAMAGIRVPDGSLSRDEENAVRTAERIGYPCVMKAQSAVLTHKTEAGGVILGVSNETALRQAWRTLQDNVARAQPGLVLDGVLVETMAPRGLELMVGAKRDPAWGPILLLGLGGIWVEALGDVRLLPATATENVIVEELMKLRTARLLTGFRGAPPVDLAAVIRAAQAVGRLMVTMPSVVEIDINPLVVYPEGQGATALDVLIVAQ